MWHRRRQVYNCWLINSIRDNVVVTCLTYRAEFQVCSAGGLSVVIRPIGKWGHCETAMLCCLKSGFKIILHFCKLHYSHHYPTLNVSVVIFATIIVSIVLLPICSEWRVSFAYTRICEDQASIVVVRFLHKKFSDCDCRAKFWQLLGSWLAYTGYKSCSIRPCFCHKVH
jgi:hypothetical protein